MRTLNYPRPISLTSFLTPNFELVADSLYWLVRRYDPDIRVEAGIESEGERVEFLVTVCEGMERGGIRLNKKKLYAADGHAVGELLKIATALEEAGRCTEEGEEEEKEEEPAPVMGRLEDVKAARGLASSITEVSLGGGGGQDKCQSSSVVILSWFLS